MADDTAEALTIGGRSHGARLTFSTSHSDGWVRTLLVEIEAGGLSADLTVDDYTLAGLPEFLSELAEGFSGWDGARTWEPVHNSVLFVSAVHRSGGHVVITWTWSTAEGWNQRWSATVTTVVEAGEEMSRLAADMGWFLAQGTGTA